MISSLSKAGIAIFFAHDKYPLRPDDFEPGHTV